MSAPMSLELQIATVHQKLIDCGAGPNMVLKCTQRRETEVREALKRPGLGHIKVEIVEDCPPETIYLTTSNTITGEPT